MKFGDNGKIDIIGVPLDLGVKELGLKLGPDSFRQVGLIDVAGRLGFCVRDLGNVEVSVAAHERDGNHNVAAIARSCRAVAERVRSSLSEGRTPICLGGDHSLAIGSLAGAAAHVGGLGCIWMDAHADANTPQTSLSGNVHGMPVAVALGHGAEDLMDLGGPVPMVAYEHMSLLGIRDIDPGEYEFLCEHEVQMFTVFDVLEHGLRSVFDEVVERASRGTRGVHVSLDLDVLHEGIAPGVGLPSRCGFDMREALYVCRRIAAECRVVSIDVVGLNPVRDTGFETARRAVELLMALLGRSFCFRYDEYLRAQQA